MICPRGASNRENSPAYIMFANSLLLPNEAYLRNSRCCRDSYRCSYLPSLIVLKNGNGTVFHSSDSGLFQFGDHYGFKCSP